jgi:hypothetical protein
MDRRDRPRDSRQARPRSQGWGFVSASRSFRSRCAETLISRDMLLTGVQSFSLFSVKMQARCRTRIEL